MLGYIKEYRFYIVLSLFILIPIIAIDTATRAPRNYQWHDRFIVQITSPIQSAVTWTLDTIIDFSQKYFFLLDVQENNTTLTSENQKLLNIIVQLKEAQKENDRLRKLLNLKDNFKFSGLSARVIAKDVSSEFRSIRINRGEDDGIKKDMAVVTQEGVVGRIYRVTPTTSDVVTVLDLFSAVDSIVERSRARGIVEGYNDEMCQLKFVLRTDDIQPGDLLISSGLGGVFPKGIPVGTVAQVYRQTYGITQNVEVVPSVNFNKLEEVMVITEFTSSPKHIELKDTLPPSLKDIEPSEEAR